MVSTANATVWATAVSKNESEGTAIIFRYIKELPKGFVRESQPNRIIITWQYDGDKGMPNSKDLARMYELEDALQSAVEDSGLSTLAIVSTGNGLREWIYYSKSEIKFFEQLLCCRVLALMKVRNYPNGEFQFK